MSNEAQAAMAKAAAIRTPTDREIITERVFDAPRERVWRAFTTPSASPGGGD